MDENQSLETLSDIRRIMERSSRFLSLSGWSGVAAGICGLGGAYWAMQVMRRHAVTYPLTEEILSSSALVRELFWVAALTLVAALLAGFVFTFLKVRRQGLSIWNSASRKLLVNLAIPLAAGGCFLLGMLYHHSYAFIGAGCLVFYGLALLNAGKFTFADIRYLGLLEIVTGLANLLFIGYSLYFLAFGFGVLHIVYGLIMWKRSEE